MLGGAILATLLLAASVVNAHPQKSYGGNLAEVLTQNGYTKLVELVVAAGLAETVTNEGPFTVFAPTNEAIAALDPKLVQGLLADTEKLKSVLLYHVVPGQVFSKQLSNNQRVDTAQGSSVKINVFKRGYYSPVVKVNGVRVVQPDLVASNGVIHGIEEVLIPPPARRPHHYSHRG